MYIWVHTIVSTWRQEEQLELQAFVGHLTCYMGARIWTSTSVLNLWSNSLATGRGLYIFYILSYLFYYVLFEETGFSLKFCIFEFDLITLWWRFVYFTIHYVNCQFLRYILNMFHLVCVSVCVSVYICDLVHDGMLVKFKGQLSRVYSFSIYHWVPGIEPGFQTWLQMHWVPKLSHQT